jgi:hypothetical protein
VGALEIVLAGVARLESVDSCGELVAFVFGVAERAQRGGLRARSN